MKELGLLNKVLEIWMSFSAVLWRLDAQFKWSTQGSWSRTEQKTWPGTQNLTNDALDLIWDCICLSVSGTNKSSNE